VAQRRRLAAWLVGLLVLAGVVELAMQVWPLIWAMPERLHPPLTEAQLRGLTPDQRLQRQQEQRRLQNQVRTTGVQGLVGLLALTGAAVGASVAWRQLQENRRHQQRSEELTREGQITDRYTKAVEQLGNDRGQLDVTLGGIFALERIAKDSPADRATIAEILTAYVRGHAPWPPTRPGQYVENAPLDRLPSLHERSPDVQAVLTVLGRMPPDERGHLDLRGTDLRKADLTGADLEEADLSGAHLELAHLDRAELFYANLAYAHLEGAWLLYSHLEGVNLSGASLRGAGFLRTHLEGADLSNTHLEANTLDMAYLEGARGNEGTGWPDGFDWRAAGVKEPYL
jgi:hypothetical protein